MRKPSSTMRHKVFFISVLSVSIYIASQYIASDQIASYSESLDQLQSRSEKLKLALSDNKYIRDVRKKQLLHSPESIAVFDGKCAATFLSRSLDYLNKVQKVVSDFIMPQPTETLADQVGGASALGWQRARIHPKIANRSVEDLPPRIFGYGSLVWRAGMPYVKRRPAEVVGFVRRFWLSSTDHRGTAVTPGRVVTLLDESEADIIEQTTFDLKSDNPLVDFSMQLINSVIRAIYFFLGINLLNLFVTKQEKTRGYVYTLDPNAENPKERWPELLDLMDEREKDGYTRTTVMARYLDAEEGEQAQECIVYVGSGDRSICPSFVGPEETARLAWRIFKAEGPSGPNAVYLENLQKGLATFPDHEHGKDASGDEHIDGLMAYIERYRKGEVPEFAKTFM